MAAGATGLLPQGSRSEIVSRRQKSETQRLNPRETEGHARVAEPTRGEELASAWALYAEVALTTILDRVCAVHTATVQLWDQGWERERCVRERESLRKRGWEAVRKMQELSRKISVSPSVAGQVWRLQATDVTFLEC